MLELIIYALLFLALIGHIIMAFRMYMAVHQNRTLPMREKNAYLILSTDLTSISSLRINRLEMTLRMMPATIA